VVKTLLERTRTNSGTTGEYLGSRRRRRRREYKIKGITVNKRNRRRRRRTDRR
jgi:hypothetical protein